MSHNMYTIETKSPRTWLVALLYTQKTDTASPVRDTVFLHRCSITVFFVITKIF